MTHVAARLTFDVAAQVGEVEATVDFALEDFEGCPALDLRQPVGSLRLDDVTLPGAAFSPENLGGGPGSEMRVLDRCLPAGSRHRLELRYPLATPAAQGAEAIGWRGDGVAFDFWMSDLHPGRYLEMWLPANVCHDRFQLRLEVAVVGGGPHRLVTNGAEFQEAPNRWRVEYPAPVHLPVADAGAATDRRDRAAPAARPGGGRDRQVAESDADLEANEADIASWLAYNEARYGPWVHGDRFTCVLWGPGRGMEYDGATTAAVGALEHEVFHSWFGRGIKPLRASRRLDRRSLDVLGHQQPDAVSWAASRWRS